MRDRRRPPWMMTVRQAEAIEREARLRGMEPEGFVEEVVDRVAGQVGTAGFLRKICEQLEWLLAGYPAEDAPYMERFHQLMDYPFSANCPRGVEPYDVPIDVFIDEVIPAAFAGD